MQLSHIEYFLLELRASVAENVTTAQASGPTGEELSFLDSS